MSKWILCFQSEKVSGVAESYFRLKRQLPTQFRKELCARAGLSNNESACSADVHNIIGRHFSCERTWSKGPVPSDVDTSQENNESRPLYLAAHQAGLQANEAMSITKRYFTSLFSMRS